jgi:hypothetical protein
MRPGITRFVKKVMFSATAATADGLPDTLEKYIEEADKVLSESKLLTGLDLETEAGANEAMKRVGKNDQLPERWAILLEMFCGAAQSALEKNDTLRAAWHLNQATGAHAMLVFVRDIEQHAWRGYRIVWLQDALSEWDRNQHNASEEFWQETLTRNAFVLSQLFSLPVVLVRERAYLGGKSLEDTGGKLVDFLVKNRLTENMGLVEIKTPVTRLLGRRYRGGVYAPSSELSGAVAQLSKYRDTFLKEHGVLALRNPGTAESFSPESIVIAGHYEKEISDVERRSSFELYRSALRDVRIVTFDELFNKTKLLIDLFGGVEPDGTPNVRKKQELMFAAQFPHGE